MADKWDGMDSVRKYSELAFGTLKETIDVAGKRVLDFGCGTGLLTEKLCGAGAKCVSIDPSEKMIKVLAQKCLSGVEAVCDYLTQELTETNDRLKIPFDLVVASSALAFVPDFSETVKIMGSVLKPGGMLVQWDWLKKDEEEGMGFSEAQILTAHKAAGFERTEVKQSFSLEGMTVVMAVSHK